MHLMRLYAYWKLKHNWMYICDFMLRRVVAETFDSCRGRNFKWDTCLRRTGPPAKAQCVLKEGVKYRRLLELSYWTVLQRWPCFAHMTRSLPYFNFSISYTWGVMRARDPLRPWPPVSLDVLRFLFDCAPISIRDHDEFHFQLYAECMPTSSWFDSDSKPLLFYFEIFPTVLRRHVVVVRNSLPLRFHRDCIFCFTTSQAVFLQEYPKNIPKKNNSRILISIRLLIRKICENASQQRFFGAPHPQKSIKKTAQTEKWKNYPDKYSRTR